MEGSEGTVFRDEVARGDGCCTGCCAYVADVAVWPDCLPDCEEAVDVCVVKHKGWVEGGVFVLKNVSGLLSIERFLKFESSKMGWKKEFFCDLRP